MKIVRKAKYLLRFKYRKGHNIHSPFVYSLVRSVFMPSASTSLTVNNDMYNKICSYNVKNRYALRWCHIHSYLEFDSYVIDPINYNNEDLVVVTAMRNISSMSSLIQSMKALDKRTVLIINGISKNQENRNWWSKIDNELVLDFNYFGVMIFDKHLSPKTYKLKL